MDEFVVYLVTSGSNPSSGMELYNFFKARPERTIIFTCRASTLPACCSSLAVRRAKAFPRWVELVVRDDGIGMSHLREGSLGYGLVRSLIQQIQGEIDVRNDAGLVVTLSFPEAAQ